MFLVFGVDNGQKRLNFQKRSFCSNCGNYADYYILMTYTCLSLFFIPTFKWSKKYFLVASCCNSFCEITGDYANRLVSGDEVFDPSKMPFVMNKPGKEKRCFMCGYTSPASFLYCPKCGAKL